MLNKSMVVRQLKIWARSAKAPYLLLAISFLQACCLPIAVDILFITMLLAKPQRRRFFLLLVTLGTFSGGIVGYSIGLLSSESFLMHLISNLGYSTYMEKAIALFANYGAIILIFSGLIPLPYMIFPLASGLLKLSLLKFCLASLLGRFLRYFIVVILVSNTRRVLSYYR